MSGGSLDVEVLIPAYNAAPTLAAALRSVQRQTRPVNRVTVVDDGSTDDTARIVRSFPGIRYVRNDRNLGCGGNWNRCLELAQADFVSLLHADDMMVAEWHARVQSALALAPDPHAACVYLGALRFRGGSDLIDAFSFCDEPAFYPPSGLLRLLWQRCFYGLTSSACMVYPKGTIRRLGPLPVAEYPNMADVPYHWRVLIGEPLVYEPRVSVLIRAGAPGQVSATRQAEHALGALRSFSAVLPELSRVMGVPPEAAAAEYLLPYWMIYARSAFLRPATSLPASVSDQAREAMRKAGLFRLMTMVGRQCVEQHRRHRWLWARREEMRALVSGIEDEL